MTSTETTQTAQTERPTFEQVVAMQLRMANYAYDSSRTEASAKLATGDFVGFAKWQLADGVRLQYRVRVLTRAAEKGQEAVVQLLGRTLGDRSRWPDGFDRAVFEAERDEALILLSELRPFMDAYRVADMTGVMV